MEPVFREERERQNSLFYKEYVNDRSAFCFHSNIELYFIDEGEMDITISGQQRTLKKNEMCVVLSFEAHTYATNKNSKSRVLIIPTYMCTGFMKVISSKKAVSPFITDHSVTKKLKSLITELISCDDNDLKKQGYLYLILGIVYENLEFSAKPTTMNEKLSRELLIYLNNNFKKDISLQTISNHFGYNQSYISRYFKLCFNISFNRYLTGLRLQNAIMMMHETDTNLTCCALESGFNSLRTFYRVFYNEFGCTPKEYKIKTDNLS